MQERVERERDVRTRAGQMATVMALAAAGVLCLCMEARGQETTASDGEQTVDMGQTAENFTSNGNRDAQGVGPKDYGWWEVTKMLFWVVVVTLGIYGTAKLVKRYVPAARNIFGGAALKVVGRMHLSPKQSIIVVKVGRRMVVVGVTPTEMRALTEITDPEEVAEMDRDIAGPAKGATTREFGQELKEASKEYESGQELLASSGETRESGAVSGIRKDLDSLSKKINLWRKTSE